MPKTRVFNIPLLIVYIWVLSKQTFVIKKLSLIGSTFFGFAQKYDTCFSKYLSKLIVPQKIINYWSERGAKFIFRYIQDL